MMYKYQYLFHQVLHQYITQHFVFEDMIQTLNNKWTLFEERNNLSSHLNHIQSKPQTLNKNEEETIKKLISEFDAKIKEKEDMYKESEEEIANIMNKQKYAQNN